MERGCRCLSDMTPSLLVYDAPYGFGRNTELSRNSGVRGAFPPARPDRRDMMFSQLRVRISATIGRSVRMGIRYMFPILTVCDSTYRRYGNTEPFGEDRARNSIGPSFPDRFDSFFCEFCPVMCRAARRTPLCVSIANIIKRRSKTKMVGIDAFLCVACVHNDDALNAASSARMWNDPMCQFIGYAMRATRFPSNLQYPIPIWTAATSPHPTVVRSGDNYPAPKLSDNMFLVHRPLPIRTTLLARLLRGVLDYVSRGGGTWAAVAGV